MLFRPFRLSTKTLAALPALVLGTLLVLPASHADLRPPLIDRPKPAPIARPKKPAKMDLQVAGKSYDLQTGTTLMGKSKPDGASLFLSGSTRVDDKSVVVTFWFKGPTLQVDKYTLGKGAGQVSVRVPNGTELGIVAGTDIAGTIEVTQLQADTNTGKVKQFAGRLTGTIAGKDGKPLAISLDFAIDKRR
jgi:hypothetical protein